MRGPLDLLRAARRGVREVARRARLGRGRLEPEIPDAFHRLFARGAGVERMATGFRFTEGPAWDPASGRLLFSDIPADRILSLRPRGRRGHGSAGRIPGLGGRGRVAVHREPSGRSNGLALDREGRLVACEHGTRRVTRLEADGSLAVLADRFRGRRLNSPNDVVVRSDGTLFFTDPPYGVGAADRELEVAGVYRLEPDGGLALVADDFVGPNGLAFSADETRLYVDDSDASRCHVRVFEVAPDGTLSGGEVFVDMRPALEAGRTGVPDGMTVDAGGHLYCTGPGGVWVLEPGGRRLGRIVTPEMATNCTFGDGDRRGLYITAVSSVYRVRALAEGLPRPSPPPGARDATRWSSSATR